MLSAAIFMIYVAGLSVLCLIASAIGLVAQKIGML